MPTLYAFERAPGSETVVIHRALDTFGPGAGAKTKCVPGEVRTFVAVGASQWPRAHDLVVRHFSGVPTRICPICFALQKYSSVRVSMGGVVLHGVEDVEFERSKRAR